MENKILSAYENRPRTLWSRLALGAVLVALMAWSATAAVDYTGASGGGQIAASIISGILHPDLSLLFNFTTEGVPYLMLETICIAFLGTVVGAVLAIPLSFLTASNLVPKPIAFVGRMAIMAIRTVPSLVYGLMFVRVTGMGAFAGLMTMALSSIGMVSKMYIEAIEDLDVKILESLDAAGCTTFQKIRYGILPQLIPNFASTAIYRFDINLRDATVLGLVVPPRSVSSWHGADPLYSENLRSGSCPAGDFLHSGDRSRPYWKDRFVFYGSLNFRPRCLMKFVGYGRIKTGYDERGHHYEKIV